MPKSWTSFLPPKLSSRNKHIYCLVVFASFIISCLFVGIGVGLGLRVRNFSGFTPLKDLKEDIGRTVIILADLYSVDPLARTMGINWLISDDTCLYESFNQTCTTVSIFFDLNLLQLGESSNTNLTNQIPTTPIFTWNPIVGSNSNISGTAFFKTTSTLIDVGIGTFSSLQDYPFDTYGTGLTLFANDTASGSPVNVAVATTGVAVGFKAISDTTDLISENGVYMNFIHLERSELIKAYVLCIIVGIWLVTFVFVGSAMKIIFNYKQPKEVFAVPIASLFAFSSLRGTMPGAPSGFGATIDFVGTLPCLAITTATSVVLFGYMVIQSNDDNKKIEYEPSFFKRAKFEGDVEAFPNKLGERNPAMTISAPTMFEGVSYSSNLSRTSSTGSTSTFYSDYPKVQNGRMVLVDLLRKGNQ